MRTKTQTNQKAKSLKRTNINACSLTELTTSYSVSLHIFIIYFFWYSGELIGVEYLYSQTDKVLGKYTPDDAEGDGDIEDESFEEIGPDLTIPPIDGSPNSPADASKIQKKSEWVFSNVNIQLFKEGTPVRC